MRGGGCIGGLEVYVHGVTTSQIITSLIVASVRPENPAYCIISAESQNCGASRDSRCYRTAL
jgi:hypothetical protein